MFKNGFKKMLKTILIKKLKSKKEIFSVVGCLLQKNKLNQINFSKRNYL